MVTADQFVQDGYGIQKICQSWEDMEKLSKWMNHFSQVRQKYNRGRRLGTTWEDDDKWVFGLTERGSLDCVLKQVPSARTRKILLPII